MDKQNAISFLKYLHSLEAKLSVSLLDLESKRHIEDVRATFLKKYRGN